MKDHIMEPGDIYTLCGRHRSGIYYQVYRWWEFARDHIEAVRANRDSTYWCLLCVNAVERRIAEEEWTWEALSMHEFAMPAPAKQSRKRSTAPSLSLFQWASDSAKQREAELVELPA